MKFGTKSKIALLGIVMLVSGCATSGVGSGCAGWKPLVLDAASIDGLSDRDAEAALAHNDFGRARGCW
jgi:hypothetical protein